MKTDAEKVIEDLKALRVKGATMTQLAEQFGLSKFTLNGLINKGASPRMATLKKLHAGMAKLSKLPAKVEAAGLVPPAPKPSVIEQAPPPGMTESQLDMLEQRLITRQLELIDKQRAVLRMVAPGVHLNGARK